MVVSQMFSDPQVIMMIVLTVVLLLFVLFSSGEMVRPRGSIPNYSMCWLIIIDKSERTGHKRLPGD
jgi:hypothetical protein